MRIVLASSEAVPFSKTGGLADVATALAKALDARGHDVTLFVPHYPQIQKQRQTPPIHPGDLGFSVPIGGREVNGRVNWSELPGSGVRVVLVDQPDYFDRPGLYQAGGHDFPDNCERFVFFSRAVTELCRRLVLRPQILHANDWQTGLIPALLAVELAREPGFRETASVFTLHNMAFQGSFWHWDMTLTGLDWQYFNWRQMESYGHLNLLKTGIAFANRLNTVSPTYALEICTPEAGCGLDGILRARRDHLSGILNGIDPHDWNPATDLLIPQTYSAATFTEGKVACKQALQERMGLEVRDVPVFGMVSRMTSQKGFDLIEHQAEAIMALDLQLAVLGTGDPHYEHVMRELAARYPGRVGVTIGFDEQLAHQIEAGSDAYLMPSLYEPCGLNQMYSLTYGTLPIVRRVGGLADTVVNLDADSELNQTATGFVFDNYRSEDLLSEIQRAVTVYADRSRWNQLVLNAMGTDWSWDRSARDYESLYEAALVDRAAGGPPLEFDD